jgi:DNA-binding CsgD family transcriptional regulator
MASLTLNDVRRGRFLINKSIGWDPVLLDIKLEKHVPEINARLTEWLATQPSLDEPFVTSCHLTPEYIQASRYVNECLKPQGIVDVMHLFLTYTSSQFAELGLARHAQHGPISRREIETSKLLLPHLRRAVTISNVLDARAIERERLAEALDALPCGVVLTNESGFVLHTNSAAERMLRTNGPITGLRGVLDAKTPAASRDLRTAIKLAAQDEMQMGRAGLAIRLTGPKDIPIFAHVLPLGGSELRTRLRPEAVAAVFVKSLPDQQNGADLLAAIFRLTPSETAVLTHVLNGLTLAETAEILGVARSTAKTHLDAIFRKTDTRRQAELVRLVMGLASPLEL